MFIGLMKAEHLDPGFTETAQIGRNGGVEIGRRRVAVITVVIKVISLVHGWVLALGARLLHHTFDTVRSVGGGDQSP